MKKILLLINALFFTAILHSQNARDFEIGMIATEPGTSNKNGVYYYGGLDEKPYFPDTENSFVKQIIDNVRTEQYKNSGANHLIISLSFIIEKNGLVSEAEVVNHAPPVAIKETLEAIKGIKTKWIPGKYKSERVRTGMYCRIIVPIRKSGEQEYEPANGIDNLATYEPVGDFDLGIEPVGENDIYIAASVQVQPEFPGGTNELINFVTKNIKKDNLLKATDIKELKVYISFVVEKDGYMTGIKLLRDPGYGLGKETIRVLKLVKTKWNPGIRNGKPVRTQYSLPVVIKMPE